MKIEIENCNNIIRGEIEIQENKLNIKYGLNGTGKTSIAKSIEYKILENLGEKELLKKLIPFGKETLLPSISGISPEIKKVFVFNEEYVKKFIFLEDELIQNSFEIFIKDEMYEKNEEKIENLLKEIKNTFINDQDIKKFIEDLNFLLTSTKTKASSTLKTLENGNKINNVTQELERYLDYIKYENSVKWLSWHSKGEDYLEIKDTCPYCTSNLVDNIDTNKDKIKLLGTEFKSNEIEKLNKTIELFDGLKNYLDNDTNSKIMKMLSRTEGISIEEKGYLDGIKNQSETLIKKLENIKNLNFANLKNVELNLIIEELDTMKIKIDVIQYFKSKVSIEKFKDINSKIENLKSKADNLKGEISIQKNKIATTVKEYKENINDFLKMSGYKYKIEFEEENEVYKIKLRHISLENNLKNVENHLSYGEKNAFALILFMYKVLKEECDLVILDDPISSFDKNKKYAIFEKLFMGKKSLKDKTVLLLTHDFDSVIDTTYNKRLQRSIQPITYFVTNNKGILKEEKIQKGNIKSCIQIFKEKIKSDKLDNLIKLIYLRRLKEIEGNKTLEYSLISSLLHKREKPSIEGVDMKKEEINAAENEVKHDIPDFDYTSELEKVKDNKKMLQLYNGSNNYEKLQIYRIINEGFKYKNNTVKKFIDETFHIENDYLFQLDPSKYITVPDYIIDICDEELKK